MRTLIVLAFVSCVSELAASAWRPDHRFLEAVRRIESSSGLRIHGDRGRSLGDFQMSRAAWADVNALRRARGEKLYDYRTHVLNPKVNRLYASGYLRLLRSRLQIHLKREPSPGELYAAYNMGLTQFSRCGFDLRRVNQVTARKCREISLVVPSLALNPR